MNLMIRAAILCGAVMLAGCTSSSISNSGYYGSQDYKGELSELELLGIDPAQPADDATIAATLERNSAASVRITPTDSLLVIQSGAEIPDIMMTEKLAKMLRFSVMSGIPSVDCRKEESHRNNRNYCTPKAYGSALRLAAAQAGHTKIMVYWGVLEQGQEDNAGTAISWLPIIGGIVPDQTHAMRIRMKLAIIDVKTGHWRILTPKVPDNTETSLSSGSSRVSAHQSLVETLKDRAYEATIAAMMGTGAP